jgi:hypothetical protein
MTDRQIPPYPDAVQTRVELVLKTYEYHLPFNYPNITVERKYPHGEFHGMEMWPIPKVDPAHGSSGEPSEGIVIVEEEPIVRVAVIGSACTPPGYVTLEAEPCEGFRRPEELETVMPLRFRIDNLWGMHLRFDQWAEDQGGRPFPESAPENLRKIATGFRMTSREFPLAGMSCAIFEIPASKRVRISGGSAIGGWTTDDSPDDAHYSFRMIRTTVAVGS